MDVIGSGSCRLWH